MTPGNILTAPRGPHSRLGASAAHRWMSCPGSIRMSEGIKQPTTIYQLEGTAAHALAAYALTTGHPPRGYEKSTYTFTVWNDIEAVDVEAEEGGYVRVPVTDEMRDAVQLYVDTVAGLETATSTTVVEKTVRFTELDMGEEVESTLDAAVLDTTKISVVDLKYGQGVTVEARDNRQLRMYALGAFLLLTPEQRLEIKEITVSIVQPRTAHVEGSVRTEYLTPYDVMRFGQAMEAAARATHRPDAPLVPGEKQCQFCPAKAHCPALSAAAQDAASDAFALAPLDAPELLPDVTRMPIEAVSELYQRAPLVRTFLTALEQRITAELAAGGAVPGFKLVEKRAQRVWAEGEEETAASLKEMGLAHDEIFKAALKSPAQIEKVVGKNKLPKEMVARVVSGVTLTTEDDPRPAVTPAEVVFPALPGPRSDLGETE